MGLRSEKVKRGPSKGEIRLMEPPVLDISIPKDQERIRAYHANQWSFYTTNGMYVMDGSCFIKPSPRGKYSICIGRVWDILPELIRKPEGAPKGKKR